METAKPTWDAKRERAYTEAAIIFYGSGASSLNGRAIVNQFCEESWSYAQTTADNSGKAYIDTFLDQMCDDDILVHDPITNDYLLGKTGTILAESFIETWAVGTAS